jgi:chemotaxis protein histidine kinase CheA
MADDGTKGPGEGTPAPGGSPAPATPPPPADDQFVKVDKGRLKDYGGDYHEALRLAELGRQAEADDLGSFKALAEANGMTAKELLAFITSGKPEGGEPPPAKKPAKPDAPQEEKPLTKAELAALLDERDNKRETQAEQRAREKAQQEVVDAASQADAKYREDALKDLDAPDEDKDMLEDYANVCLVKAIEERLAKDVRIPASRRRDHALAAVATKADYALAKELLAKKYKDMESRIIAKASKRTKGLPNQTLGGGKGGPTPPPSGPPLSLKERAAKLHKKWESAGE